MKRNSVSGFTLIEMLTVMFIIAILAALILGVHGFVNYKASMARATGEIQAMTASCESYKADNGSYPRSNTLTTGSPQAGNTEGAVTGTVPHLTQAASPISPMQHGNPLSSNYQQASLYLYRELSGDTNLNGIHESTEAQVYYNFRPDQIGTATGAPVPNDGSGKVTYLKDPFGNSYGYSTAAATDEEAYQQNLASDPTSKRPNPAQGFNSTFDLWSTGGRVNTTMTPDPNSIWARWAKNW